jgi:hypothetical protein
VHERISGRPRDAVFKCLSDPTVPLSVWIVPTTARTLRSAFEGCESESETCGNSSGCTWGELAIDHSPRDLKLP